MREKHPTVSSHPSKQVPPDFLSNVFYSFFTSSSWLESAQNRPSTIANRSNLIPSALSSLPPHSRIFVLRSDNTHPISAGSRVRSRRRRGCRRLPDLCRSGLRPAQLPYFPSDGNVTDEITCPFLVHEVRMFPPLGGERSALGGEEPMEHSVIASSSRALTVSAVITLRMLAGLQWFRLTR